MKYIVIGIVAIAGIALMAGYLWFLMKPGRTELPDIDDINP